MKKLILFITLSFLFTTTYAQNDSTILVIGLEVGSIFNNEDNRIGYGRNYSYGLSVEYPKNQFSIGLATLYKSYGSRLVQNFTGESETELVNGKMVDQFHYYNNLLEFDYLALSTRLIYRVPCNCAYIYASYDFEFLNDFNQVQFQSRSSLTNETPSETINRAKMKSVNSTLELGFGLKAHFSERFRLNMRFTYGITQTPSRIITDEFTGDFNYMKISLGFQYALKGRG